MSDLRRVVIVTGGGSGIGYACAEELLRRGMAVLIAGRSGGKLTAAAELLQGATGARPHVEVADVREADDVERVVAMSAELGPLHGLIHAAGIYGPIGAAVDVSATEWLDAIRANLHGTFLAATAVARAIIRSDSGGGSIVLLAGGGAATPFPNYSAYAASKAAVVRFAETLAIELGPASIRVNAIAPGFVATELHARTLAAGPEQAGDFYETTKERLKNAIPPSVAAKAAAFLLSDDAMGITGRFVAAPYDRWDEWPKHLSEIQGSDLFTLRRIVPRDRGADWQ